MTLEIKLTLYNAKQTGTIIRKFFFFQNIDIRKNNATSQLDWRAFVSLKGSTAPESSTSALEAELSIESHKTVFALSRSVSSWVFYSPMFHKS